MVRLIRAVFLGYQHYLPRFVSTISGICAIRLIQYGTFVRVIRVFGALRVVIIFS